MANVSVYNMEGKEVGTLELNDAVFGVEAVSYTHLDVYKRQDMRKGTMVRVLTTLEEEGFVRYDEISKRYSLGMSIYVLSSNCLLYTSIGEPGNVPDGKQHHSGCPGSPHGKGG